MKPIIAIITEEDIRFRIEEAARELEEDAEIHFPDADARAEFLDDCTATVIDKYELYDHDPFRYMPNYHDTVLDMARLYDYLA